jgi:hypothetical protein
MNNSIIKIILFSQILLFNNISTKNNNDNNNKIKRITLKSNNDNNYYINIYSYEIKIPLIFSTYMKKSLIASSYCRMCKGLKYEPSKLSEQIVINSSQLLIQHNFTGNEYREKFYLNDKFNDDFSLNLMYISFKNVTYLNIIDINGYMSLTFTNYNLSIFNNNNNKIFCLNYNQDKDEFYLDLNDIDNNEIKNKENLNYYPITYTSDRSLWYLSSNKVIINNKDNNITIDMYFKIILDMGTNVLYIPKKFFFENYFNFFPLKSNCQIQTNGIFLCECEKENIFPKILFVLKDNKILKINLNDFIEYNSYIGDKCYMYIKINYENEYFIVGNNFFKKYYSIFDIGNNLLGLYEKNEEKKLLYVYLFVGSVTIFLIIAIFFIVYKKFFKNKNKFRQEEFNRLINA